MKTITACLFPMFFAVACFAQKQFVVYANAERRVLEKSFNEIKVANGIDIFLSQSDDAALAVSASEQKYISSIKTVVENNTLSIYYDGETSRDRNRKMTVYVSFINLQKLEASGASDITVAGTINTTALQLLLSGASDFIGDVSVTSLEIALSGASDVKISGMATNLNIESSGASDVNGFGLATEICTAKASGASDINVTVNKELDAHASGASNIYYEGTGIIKNVQANGASSVGKKRS